MKLPMPTTALNPLTRLLIPTTVALLALPSAAGATTQSPYTMPAEPLQTWIGTGLPGYNGDNARTLTSLTRPQGVAADASYDVFVADTGNNRIRMMNPKGYMSTVAGSGMVGYTGDGGPATAAGLDNPYGVAVDGAGDLFIADTGDHRVREVTPDGIIHTVAGNGIAGTTGDGGQATQAELNAPVDLALDGHGDLFISDGTANVIREVTTDGLIHTFAGTGVAGFNGDCIPASQALVNDPTGLAIDAAGDVFFTDTANHRVREVTTDGTIHTIAGTGIWGYAGDHGAATYAELESPTGLTIDSQGDLYVSDVSSATVRAIVNNVIFTVAGTGTPGYNGDGFPAATMQLDDPVSVAIDSYGAIQIADSYINRIRRVA
jgi:hypothetical protein